MITILGRTGFVGSAIETRLLEDGKNVTGLSRPKFDLGNKETYSSIPDETSVLVHSAGPAGPEHPEDRYWKESVQATYDLIEFIISNRKNIQHIIYVSSGAVYAPAEQALTENSRVNPANLYAMSRFLSENIIRTRAECKTTILRLFFPYGPSQQPPRLIPELARKIVHGERISLNGHEGRPKINPIYIGDLVDNVLNFIDRPDKEMYNLGGSEIVTIKELADLIGAALGVAPKFEFNTNKSLNYYCSCGTENKVSLASGINLSLDRDCYES